ncbi:MAG TPA: TetR/AcrR family transcriptional regulator [Deltaproteobacteria bacterium]|nr:TetR/AcrR family transcriptional regulator [Deltaproteobacteria bacterium]
MPKAARSQEDIELIREKILDAALAIISEHGFKFFSMRKLASSLSMSATTIYNYYSNKDELYLMILTRGFDMLYKDLFEIFNTRENPLERLRDMVSSYVSFGTKNANYYNIMFTSDAPKYRDYIGTDIEPVAYFEKETALQLVDIAAQVIQELAGTDHGISMNDARYLAIKLWSFLHGIIALSNSRVLREVDDNPEKIIERIIEDIIQLFISKEVLHE